MKNNSPHRTTEINLLISVALSLIINFSYLVSLNLNTFQGNPSRFRDDRPHDKYRHEQQIDSLKSNIEKRDSLNHSKIETAAKNDIKTPGDKNKENSIHNNANNHNINNLQKNKQISDSEANIAANNIEATQTESQNIVTDLTAPTVPDSLESEVYIREQNIKLHYDRFDPMKYYKKQYKLLMISEMSYFMLLSFILLTIATARMGLKNKRGKYIIRLLFCIGVAFLFYYIAPQMTWRGRIIITMQSQNLFNPMLMLKVTLVLIVAAMYSKIYELIFQRQAMVLENEQLKNENLISQYTVLINQLNPHFFFNSLNSLSMLIRENRNQMAQEYIDKLSNTFRYLIQESTSNVTTLENELKFVESYKYLFEIRYAGKFFVNINVDKDKLHMQLPSLSMQPLIENAVKHNTITRIKPMTITITTENDYVVISNPIIPKIDDSETRTGIGLKNLSSRYILLIKKPIIIENDGITFTVKLPLIKENKNENRHHRR